MSLLPFCEWLARTEWSIALHESLYVYPLVETAHVLSLLLFVGSIIFIDLRLLGATLREAPVTEVTSRILPWTFAGFAVAVVSGALLFYAIPVRTFLSIFFRIKVLLLFVFQLRAVRGECICTETCEYASDVFCNDGGPGSDYGGCALGTDCTDCGPRGPGVYIYFADNLQTLDLSGVTSIGGGF